MTDPILGTSHAKLNWWLRVGALRPDGYHKLETVYQELALAEQVSLARVGEDECVLTGFPPDIPAEKNLVTLAWRGMKAAFPGRIGGVHFSIIKTLPQGGGLGGGSSNAAWAIKAINRLYELHAPPQLLRQVGAGIGSDVAFFINGGTAVGRGRGEIMENLPPCPKYWLVLVMPEERMPTADGYRLLDTLLRSRSQASDKPHTLSPFLTSLYAADPHQLASVIHNDFDLVAETHAWYRKSREELMSAGALRTFLCGSGSTVAGLVTDETEAFKIAELVGGVPTSTLTQHLNQG